MTSKPLFLCTFPGSTATLCPTQPTNAPTQPNSSRHFPGKRGWGKTKSECLSYAIKQWAYSTQTAAIGLVFWKTVLRFSCSVSFPSSVFLTAKEKQWDLNTRCSINGYPNLNGPPSHIIVWNIGLADYLVHYSDIYLNSGWNWCLIQRSNHLNNILFSHLNPGLISNSDPKHGRTPENVRRLHINADKFGYPQVRKSKNLLFTNRKEN